MSEKSYKRMLIGIIMTWTFACGFVPLVIVGCATTPKKAKPSAGIRYIVPPQCFAPMYCATPDCQGARASYHCYQVVKDEPKGDTK